MTSNGSGENKPPEAQARKLDSVLAGVAREASAMLAGLSFTERNEFAKLLGTDSSGLEQLTNSMSSFAAVAAASTSSDGIVAENNDERSRGDPRSWPK